MIWTSMALTMFLGLNLVASLPDDVEWITINEGAFRYLSNRSHVYNTSYPYTCFNESERVQVTYLDDPETLVDLPTLSVLSGGWESQTASNVIGFILLQEKMGIPMTWWPGSDPEQYWAADVDYPNSYSYWYEAGLLDINFEVWESYLFEAKPATQKMIFNGTLSIASLGVFGSQGLYVPAYVLDEYPYANHYKFLNDTDFQNRLITDQKNYFDWLKANDNDTFDTWIWQDGQDFEGTEAPVHWSPHPSWVMPRLLKQMTDQFGLGFNQIHCGSETKLSRVIRDLYANRSMFVTYTYTPNALMAGLDFRRIHFPDNPSGTAADQCRLDDSCRLSDDSIYSLWHSRMAETVPEAVQFIRTLQLNRVQLSTILDQRATLLQNNPGMSPPESFFNATCQWLKDNRDVWSDAIVNIQRKKAKKKDDNSLKIILGSAMCLVGLVILAFFVHRIYKMCKQIQSSFDEGLTLENQYRRKLMMDNVTDIAMTFSTLFDFCTDASTVFNIVFLWADDYSESFVITYAVFGIFAIIVTSADLAIRLTNIQETTLEIKNGVDMNNVKVKSLVGDNVRNQLIEKSKTEMYRSTDNLIQGLDLDKMKPDDDDEEDDEDDCMVAPITPIKGSATPNKVTESEDKKEGGDKGGQHVLSVVESHSNLKNDDSTETSPDPKTTENDGAEADDEEDPNYALNLDDINVNHPSSSSPMIKGEPNGNGGPDGGMVMPPPPDSDEKTLQELLQKRTYVERWLRGDAISIFVAIVEEIPFLVLNIYSIMVLGVWSSLVFFSTLSTACTMGYKLYALTNFFNLLTEKRVVEKRLQDIATIYDHKSKSTSAFHSPKKKLSIQAFFGGGNNP